MQVQSVTMAALINYKKDQHQVIHDIHFTQRTLLIEQKVNFLYLVLLHNNTRVLILFLLSPNRCLVTVGVVRRLSGNPARHHVLHDLALLLQNVLLLFQIFNVCLCLKEW